MRTLNFAKIHGMKLVITTLFTLFLSATASAYPDFIGYGYASCLTCHFNGQGSGPLNDYGRALWSAEIASRALYPKSMSDEEIVAVIPTLLSNFPRMGHHFLLSGAMAAFWLNQDMS